MSRQHLRSATQQLLVVPRHQLSSYGRWAFCVAGPSVMEFHAGHLAESDYWREQFQTISEDISVRNVLMHPAYRFHDDALYKSTFHLLTYLPDFRPHISSSFYAPAGYMRSVASSPDIVCSPCVSHCHVSTSGRGGRAGQPRWP